MIKTLENGIKVIELGKGDTFISQVMVDHKEGEEAVSSGICFGNKPTTNGEIEPENIIIEIVNFQGALSYMTALVNLLETWNIEGAKPHIEAFRKDMERLIGK